jgi:hypothetical protein
MFFKSVIFFNRFKKFKLLESKRGKMGKQKKKLCKGAFLKKNLAGGNAKHAHLAGG